jgi:cobalt/nickel transport system permease protein
MENTLDIYAHHNGLKDVNSYFKVLFAILTMIVCLVSTSPVIPIFISIFIAFLLIFLAKIPLKFYLKFISIPFIFGFLTFVLMSLFFGMNEQWFNIGLFNLAVYKDGFNLGFLVFTRIMGCFSCLGFLSLTTPTNHLFSLLDSLEISKIGFKIPKIVLELAMLMYRFIFVFLEETSNMYHSQETRLGYSTFNNSIKSMGMLASNLFIKTWLRGDQVYMAMESRCYDGSIKIRKHESIKNIGNFNLALLAIFEVILFIGTYLTGNFRIF